MKAKKNNNPVKPKKGAHAIEKQKSKPHYFILTLLIILIITIGIYFSSIYILSNKNDNNILSNSVVKDMSDIHQFENANYLFSKDFTISVKNGVSETNGTITNNSNNTLRKMKCVYSLLDSSNNVVFELDISAAKINANDSSSFSSISAVDLSNVVNYTVRLAE